MECLKEDVKKKHTDPVQDEQITTNAKLLDITQKSYGFSGVKREY